MRKTFILSLFLLISCGVEKPLVNDAAPKPSTANIKSQDGQEGLYERQKAAAQKYRDAIFKHQEKMRPINKYLISVCRRLKNDAKYIHCMNEKKAEIIANSLFPDLEIDMFKVVSDFEQQLLEKKISRKKFMEQLEKIGKDTSNQVNERASKDVRAGNYRGNL